MQNYDSTLVTLCLAVMAAFVFLLLNNRTAFFGLTFLNVVMVASASLAGMFVTMVFLLDSAWLTEYHEFVVKYSALGCLAMAGGIWLALRRHPVVAADRDFFAKQAPWLNDYCGWAILVLGVAGALGLSLLRGVPTLSTGFVGIMNLMRFGLFVLFASGLLQKKMRSFWLGLGVSMLVQFTYSLRSGHTFLPLDLVVPLVFIACFFPKIRWSALVILPVFLVIGIVLMGAWMQTREIIRSGELREAGIVEAGEKFLNAYLNELNLEKLEPEEIRELVFMRIDMTEYLALQAAYQPDIEPYAYGGTFANVALALIPRAVWPEKPAFAGGSEFVNRYTGMLRPDNPDDITSLGLPYQFEFYANGGPWLVVLGLFLIGFLSARLEVALFCPQPSVRRLLMLAVITLIVCDGGERMDTTIPGLVAATLTVYTLGWYLEYQFPQVCARILGQAPGVVPGRAPQPAAETATLPVPLL